MSLEFELEPMKSSVFTRALPWNLVPLLFSALEKESGKWVTRAVGNT